eukprot:TRINITY_DN5990_c0_g1_i1.p1 TRINITY_DN5990_c0_g1~~TRINITY_DN5990_c0_g1_i1.p1  ORF type:complete len:418 (+),score=83.92 TRINITY_DN5990_c0_g1_i1:150-1403(+)
MSQSTMFHPLAAPTPQTALQTGVAEGLVDSEVASEVAQFLRGSTVQPRKRMTINEVQPTIQGLHSLLQHGEWPSVAALAEQCFTQSVLPHVALEIRLAKLFALVKLKRFKSADRELAAIGDLDSASYLFESYPDVYGDRKGSMVPFTLRVIHATLPHHLGNHSETIDRLYVLLDVCKLSQPPQMRSTTALASADDQAPAFSDEQQPDFTTADMSVLTDSSEEAQRKLWQRREHRLLSELVSYHMQSPSVPFSTVLKLLNNLRRHRRTDLGLVCTIGRAYLQMGDIAAAEQTFIEADHLQPGGVETVLNKAFLHLAGGRYGMALPLFERVLSTRPGDAIAANNVAVCQLYTHNVPAAINSLEAAVRTNPLLAGDATVVGNLSALYDLAFDDSARRKKVLQGVLAVYAPQMVDANTEEL